MTNLTQSQRDQLTAVAEVLDEQLSRAWNYVGLLNTLSKEYDADDRIFKTHSHFFGSIAEPLWDALMLKMHHCVDTRREAHGFPKLFKLIRRCCAADPETLDAVDVLEKSIRTDEVADKIRRWRNEIIAHRAHSKLSFPTFRNKNRCKIHEIGLLVGEYQGVLNRFAVELIQLRFHPYEFNQFASESVRDLIENLKHAEHGGQISSEGAPSALPNESSP